MYRCCEFIVENFTMLRNFHPNLTSNRLPQCCMIWSSTFDPVIEHIPRWNQVAFSASQYSQNEILDLLYTGLLCLVLCIVSSLNQSFVQSGLSSAQIALGHIGTKTLILKDIGYKNIPSYRCIIASSSFMITIALLLCEEKCAASLLSMFQLFLCSCLKYVFFQAKFFWGMRW